MAMIKRPLLLAFLERLGFVQQRRRSGHGVWRRASDGAFISVVLHGPSEFRGNKAAILLRQLEKAGVPRERVRGELGG
jgi:predicted RNA binding protein YcfA (HicA-like mRNA interferase family)